MIEKGVKSKDLAEKLGKTKQYISNVVNETTNVSVQMLSEIASVLDVPVWMLFVSREEVVGEEKDDNSITFPSSVRVSNRKSRTESKTYKSLDIKRVIKERGLEVREVAKRMGITPTGLSQHINGNPSVETLERIANAIGCSPGEFFLLENQTTQSPSTSAVHVSNWKNNLMNIETLLKEKGLSKSDFARIIGVNRQNINSLLTNPTLSTLERMSKALNVPMWQLFATREEIVGENQEDNSIICPKCGARFRMEE